MNRRYASVPAHMEYPGIWRMAGKVNLRVLHGYLVWLKSDPKRWESAASAIQWIEVGIHALTVAVNTDPKGNVISSIQMNFYHEDYPGNEHPHAHSRPAKTWWCAPPKTRQIIHRSMLLSEGAPRLRGIKVNEARLTMNCIEDLRDGRRPKYRPVDLGTRLVLDSSTINVAPLGSQAFRSFEIHHVGFEGKGVAISVHHKGPIEPASLNSLQGLVCYKGLTPSQAEWLRAVSPERGAKTILLPPHDFSLDLMAGLASTPPFSVANALLHGALQTAERVARAA